MSARTKLRFQYDDGGRGDCHFKCDWSGDCGARAVAIAWHDNNRHVPRAVAYLRALALTAVAHVETRQAQGQERTSCDAPYLVFEGQVPGGVLVGNEVAQAIGYRRVLLGETRLTIDQLPEALPGRLLVVETAQHFSVLKGRTIRDSWDIRARIDDIGALEAVWLREDEATDRDEVRLVAKSIASTVKPSSAPSTPSPPG